MNRSFSEGGGSMRLFRAFGIEVFLHWSWVLVALYEINQRQGNYSSPIWNVLEYVTLFAIVLMHEFGHALACRSVGGQADRIVLWPLGGVAFVAPPQRPGAVLWSIVAGPLVNVVLVPVFWLAWQYAFDMTHSRDIALYAREMFRMNLLLLIFNLLPIYPLDGGKIVWALLWFPLGRGKALRIAGVIGIIGAVGVLALAVYEGSIWIAVLAVFGLMQSWQGLKSSRIMDAIDSIPRHLEARCPACGEHPVRGPFWKCTTCGAAFDTFDHRAICPQCRTNFGGTTCFACGQGFPIEMWLPNHGFPMHAPPPPMGQSTIAPE